MRWDAVAIVCVSCVVAEVVLMVATGAAFGYGDIFSALLASILTAAVIKSSDGKRK